MASIKNTVMAKAVSHLAAFIEVFIDNPSPLHTDAPEAVLEHYGFEQLVGNVFKHKWVDLTVKIANSEQGRRFELV